MDYAGIYLLLPRQLGDNWTPDSRFLTPSNFERLEVVYQSWRAANAG